MEKNENPTAITFYLIAKEIIEQKLGIRALRGDVSRLALLLKTIEEKSEQKNTSSLVFLGELRKK